MLDVENHLAHGMDQKGSLLILILNQKAHGLVRRKVKQVEEVGPSVSQRSLVAGRLENRARTLGVMTARSSATVFTA